MKKVGLLLGIVALLAFGISAAMAENNSPDRTVTYTGQGFEDGALENEKCGADQDLGQDKDFEVGEDGAYLKWVLTAAGADSATISGPFGENLEMIQVPGQGGIFHKATDYFPVEELIAFPVTASWVGGPQSAQLTVSNGCAGFDVATLAVSKTAVTSYTRTHDWSIEKSVDTEEGHEIDDVAKIWLYIDGSGDETATWTVDVTYEGFVDSDHNVSGEISIENISQNTQTIASVVDVIMLSGDDDDITVDVECNVTFPYDLPVGETLTCTYSQDVDGEIDGVNHVTVTKADEDNTTYKAEAEIIWGAPTTEINKTVSVVDSNDGFALKYGDDDGNVILDAGDFDEGEGKTFTYDQAFAWENYGQEKCGSFQYDNTASIIGDDGVVLDSADASLKVNVQCFLFDSAWAKGDNPDAADEVLPFCNAGFNNWGWTNKIGEGFEGEWDLWAGAGRCDTSKGTLVGTVSVEYADDGSATVVFNLDDGYLLGSTAVYADSGKFPTVGRQNRPTTAPGQYYIGANLSGDIWVIAHANVGIPDPNFGP